MTELNKEELRKTYECYKRLYNKEPLNQKEFLLFNEVINSISRTFDITYDQINKKILEDYYKLLR